MVRNYFLLIIIAFSVTSCATLQRNSRAVPNNAGSTATSRVSSTNSPQFINAIEVNQDKMATVRYKKPSTNYKSAYPQVQENATLDIERANLLQFTYAAKLGTEVESITNLKLFQLIDEWWGTQYRLGGTTKSGVDCSAFVLTIMAAVYGINLPRTSKEQYDMATKISDEELTEGDLVFFNTRGGISHVGIFLTNNKFVHASTSGGVMISDLNEPYWKYRYRGAGRVK